MSRLEKTQVRKITDMVITNISNIRSEQKNIIKSNKQKNLVLGLCKMEYNFSIN